MKTAKFGNGLARSRTRGVLAPLPVTYATRRTVLSTGKPVAQAVSTTQSLNMTGDYRIGTVMTDTVTPNFKTISASGGVVNNPMVKMESMVDIMPYFGPEFSNNVVYVTPPTWSNYYISNTTTIDGRIPNVKDELWPLMPLVQPVSDLQIQAVNAAFADGKQVDVMATVDLLEFDKTLRMISTNIAQLLVIIRRAKRYDISTIKGYKRTRVNFYPVGKYDSGSSRNGTAYRDYVWATGESGVIGSSTTLSKRAHSGGKTLKVLRPKSTAKDLPTPSEKWLEYQYGINPLMMSIEGSINILLDLVKPERQSFRGYKNASGSSSSVSNNNISLPAGRVQNVRRDITIDYSQEARAGVLTEWKPSLLQQLGMSSRDTAGNMYELVPFSFVLDWFLHLGNFINAVSLPKEFATLASWCVNRSTLTTTYKESRESLNYSVYTGGATPYTTYYTYNGYSCSIVVTTVTTERVVDVKPQLPPLDTEFTSINHLLSSIALMLSSKNVRKVARI